VHRRALRVLLFVFAASLGRDAAAQAQTGPDVEPRLAWATTTGSPARVPEAILTDRESQLESACGVGERGLRTVAVRIVQRKLLGLPYLDEDELNFAQRVAGEPHVWSRAWIAAGRALDQATTLARLVAWRNSFRDGGERRCGVAIGFAADGSEVVAAVALDALGDLAPLPVRTRTGLWLTVDATLRVSATSARVLLLGPSGEPRAIPSSFDGNHVRARFAPDRPGEFAVQVLADVDSGPRPILEARVFADVDPPTREPNLAAPGEQVAAGPTDAATLQAMIEAMRAAEHLPALVRDPRLDAVAEAHARRMMRTGSVGHDLGDGDPGARLAAAGLSARVAGENLARAKTVQLAHRALYASPSHRANLVRGTFDRLGLAVVEGDDGSRWVAELFASGLR
jgi:uncharacterized protein YkwD